MYMCSSLSDGLKMNSLRINNTVEGGYQAYNKGLINHNKINFTGSPAKIIESAGKEIGEAASKKNFFIRFNEFFEKKKEQNTIIITAIGTGIVAPIVLAINPISKEDSNTKKYTALRQPISAVLALLTQIGINAPIPRALDKSAAKCFWGHDYLPDPKNEKSKFTPEQQAKINEHFEVALNDEGFKNRIADFNYKTALEDVEKNAIKDVSYMDRFFNSQAKANIKKEIAEKSQLVKKLGVNEIKLEHAIKYTSKNLETFKNLVGIGASVIVLYPAFSILNWVYPRFVEHFFPQLVKEKDNKGQPVHPVVVDYKNPPQSVDNKSGKVGV